MNEEAMELLKPKHREKMNRAEILVRAKYRDALVDFAGKQRVHLSGRTLDTIRAVREWIQAFVYEPGRSDKGKERFISVENENILIDVVQILLGQCLITRRSEDFFIDTSRPYFVRAAELKLETEIIR